jgi:hypothetical protein
MEYDDKQLLFVGCGDVRKCVMFLAAMCCSSLIYKLSSALSDLVGDSIAAQLWESFYVVEL